MACEKKQLNSLPDDVIFEILLRLPVKSLVRLSIVRKSWRKLIITNNEVFARFHLNRAIANNENHVEVLMYNGFGKCCEGGDLQESFDRVMKSRKVAIPLYLGKEFQVAGCCDGLLCYYKLNSSSIYIWNPALHQRRTLLTSGDMTVFYSDFVGFGYDPQNQDYKVVKLSLGRTSGAEVYSLKHSSWKSITVDPSNNGCSFRNKLRASSLSFNGCIHWIAEIPFYERGERAEEFWILVVFGIADEKLNLFTLPSLLSTHDLTFARMGVLNGCLSFITWSVNCMKWDIWSMKTYGVRNSWTKVAVIDCLSIGRCNPVGLSAATGKILVLNRDNRCVYLYDLESRKMCPKLFDLIRSDHSKIENFFVADYMESLISVFPSPSVLEPSISEPPLPSGQ